MPSSQKDPTKAICEKAASYPGVTQGTACNQTSFKIGNKSFLYIGPQGGRYKAMFKLSDSLSQAGKLAQSQPDAFEVGKQDWVTARFSVDAPLAKAIWSKWLDESYRRCAGDEKPVTEKAKTKKKVSKKKSTARSASTKSTNKK